MGYLIDTIFVYEDGRFVPWFLVYTWLVLGVPLWRILTKAGFSGAWVLLLVVPPLGWPMATLLLAFARWPVHANRPEENEA